MTDPNGTAKPEKIDVNEALVRGLELKRIPIASPPKDWGETLMRGDVVIEPEDVSMTSDDGLRTNGAHRRHPLEPPPGFFEEHDSAPLLPPDGLELEATCPDWDRLIVRAPVDWYTRTPAPRDWLLRDRRTATSGTAGDGVLPRATVAILAAEDGAGKTTGFGQLAVAVASGAPWFGAITPEREGRVLFLAAEETADEVRRQLWRAARVANVAAGVVAERIDVMGLHGLDSSLLTSGPMASEPVPTSLLLWLRKRVERERYDLVALDPHARLGGRDVEISQHAATRAIQAYESLTAWGAAVVVAHHTAAHARTASAGEVDPRGVTALRAGARAQWGLTVERLPSAPPQLREVITLAPRKSSYARKWAPIYLRRDSDLGGALVPCDAADLELVAEARSGAAERAEREETRTNAAISRRGLEDAALLRVLGDEELSERAILARLREELGRCSDGAGKDAIERAIAAKTVERRKGPRNAHLMRRTA